MRSALFRQVSSRAGKREERWSAGLLKAQQLPFALTDETGPAGEIGDAVIGMAGGAKLAADKTRGIALDDRADDAGAAGRGIRPGNGLSIKLVKIRRGHCVAHRGFVGDAVGGYRSSRDRARRYAAVDLGRAQIVHAAADAAAKGEKGDKGDSRRHAFCKLALCMNGRLCYDFHPDILACLRGWRFLGIAEHLN